MKILICSKLFYPSNAIGAVRPSNFAKYLAGFGHEITVIAEETQDNEVIGFQGIEIIRISNSKTIKRLIQRTQNYIFTKNADRKFNQRSQPPNTSNKLKKHIFLNIKDFFRASRRQIHLLLIEIDWFFRAKKTANSMFNRNSFDVVISSYGPFGSYLLGYFVSKSKIARHWISDLRDKMPNTNYPFWHNVVYKVADINYPFWLNLLYKVAERKMVSRADAITLVSQGQVSMFCKSLKDISFDKNKIYSIYNGYENNFKPVHYKKRDKILRISYTGQLYSNLRDFRLLFRVLDDLIKEQLIDLNSIVLYYAGQSSIDFKKQLHQFDVIKKACQNVGFVDRNTALEIQNSSDILVALTWNTDTDQGILTAKFMEYLQVYKPIISLTSGNLPNGELSQMIEKLNLGIACEYITYDKDYIRLKEYLLTQYNRIQEGNPLLFEPDIEGIQKFHYEKLTMELNNICITIGQTRRK